MRRRRGMLERVMAVAAAGFLAAAGPPACSDQAEREGGGVSKKPVRVQASEVFSRTFRQTVRAVGSIDATEAVKIRPEVSGLVKEAQAREGMEVAAGDPLFRLEDDSLLQRLAEQERALDAAEARLENTRANHRRLRSLWERRVIAKDRWDRIQTEVEVAQAEVERLQASIRVVGERIEDTRIRAPFAGTLSERLVDPGDLVQPGQPLVTLYRRGGKEAVFRVPERYAGVVTRRQPAEVRVEAFPDRVFPAEVVYVSPELDPRTRRFQVKALVEDPKHLLKPGMFARVQVIIARREHRVAVPEEALVPVRTGYAVFVVEQGKARRRSVEIGLRRVGVVEIVKGLKPGETVVRKGHLQLADGDPVQPANQGGASR